MELVELNNTELQFVNGGNFAYDAGWSLHFLWDAATYDYEGEDYDIAAYYLHYHKS